MRPVGFVLASLLFASGAGAVEKVGFVWYDVASPCVGGTDVRSVPNPTGHIIKVESMRVRIGALPPSGLGPVDATVSVHTSSGQLMELVSDDKYTNPGSVAVNALRTYRTPWRFRPIDGLIISTECSTWAPDGVSGQILRVTISVEGIAVIESQP